jgi:hypothetical protein
MKIRVFISLIIGLSMFTSGINTPLHATDTFQNSLTLDETKLIESIEGVCPNDPTKSKQIRINDAIQKNTKIHLLWSFTCDDASSGLSTIMISTKTDGIWISHTVSSDRKFYIDRNYLGAPNFVDLNEDGVGIIWSDFNTQTGKRDLIGKIFDGNDASQLVSAASLTIASSTDCGIGNILPISNSSGVFLIYLTNNGGAEFCMGDLHATQFLNGNWVAPVLIDESERVGDLYKENNLAITSSGDAYICYTTMPSYENPGNLVKVVKLSAGVPSVEFSRIYSNIETNSAFYCSIEIDQFDQPHLLVAEIAWTRSASESGTGISADPSSQNFREFTKVVDLWQESEGSLDVVNSNLDDSFSFGDFCNQCQDSMTLIVTSESSKVKLYSYGSDENWTLSRNFNEDYDQDVQNIQEVWGNPTTGYTFLINNFADELEGTFGYQKGHFFDVKPTFSPPSVNKLLFSDSVYEEASQIFRDEFETIFTRLTSRGVIKAGNSLISMWEDLGNESTPPRTIFIERILKDNPSCTDSNFAPGKPEALVASSVYTTAILSFLQSRCGSAPTQAIVEVRNVTTGITQEISVIDPQLSIEIPNLQDGNTYAFKVKLTNNYGTSNFTAYSNLVVATRQTIQIPQGNVPPTEVIQNDSTKPKEVVIPEKIVKEEKPNTGLVLNENTVMKLRSSGLRTINPKSIETSQNYSIIELKATLDSKGKKSLKIDSKKFIEISIKPFASSPVKVQLVVGKKTIYIGHATPAMDSFLKLPPLSFNPGKYLLKFTSPSAKPSFVTIKAK